MRVLSPAAVALVLALAGLTGFVGCAAPAGPPPLRVPTLAAEVDHYQGSPLSGPRLGVFADYPALPPTTEPDTALAVTLAAYAAAGMPAGGLRPLSSAALLATAPLSGDPLRATLPIMETGMAGRESGRLARAREQAQLVELPAALDLGMSAALILRDPTRPAHSLELHVHRPPGGGPLQAHLVQQVRGSSQDDELSWDQVLLDVEPLVDGEPLVVTTPLANGTGELVLAVQVLTARPGDVGHRVTVERARGQARAHHTELLTLLDRLTAGVPDHTAALAALAGIEAPGQRRGALAWLAGHVNARATLDLALSDRAALVDSVAARAKSLLPAAYQPTLAELLWVLEEASLSVLADHMELPEPDAVAEAMLLRHSGEVGRNAPLLLGLLEAAANHADLQRRLVDENLLFLDDNSPASRVRAFDWLLSHGPVPAGYEPLAPRADRRKALLAFREALELPAQGAQP